MTHKEIPTSAMKHKLKTVLTGEIQKTNTHLQAMKKIGSLEAAINVSHAEKSLETACFCWFSFLDSPFISPELKCNIQS